MTSKQVTPVAGFHLTIYGLDEYMQQPKRMPIAAMFVLHCSDSYENATEPLCNTICSLNTDPGRKRHMIAIVFDPSTCLSKSAGGAESIPDNDSTSFSGDKLDSWQAIHAPLRTLSSIMDILDYHLFGAYQLPRIQAWGITGYSLSGTIAYWAAAVDPRFSVVIPIASVPDYLPIARRFLNLLPETEDVYLERPAATRFLRQDQTIESQLSQTKVLLLGSSTDGSLPAREVLKFADRLREVHRGKEGDDWAMEIVSSKHGPMPSCMLKAVSHFCGRWMANIQELSGPRAML